MNPCLDRYIYVDKLVVDDTIRAKKTVDYPAGKGIDVSRVIKELGGVSVAISLIGGDTGRKLEEMLDKEGVIYSSIRVPQETRLNVILETKSKAIKLSNKIQSVPNERIKEELKKILTQKRCANVLKEMAKDGILFEIFPCLKELKGLRQSSLIKAMF